MQNKNFVIYFEGEGKQKNELEEILQKQSVSLKNKEWNNRNMKAKCLQISEWRINELWLSTNQSKTLLKEISNIKFPNLKLLSLRDNFIESIQGLNRLKIPVIESIWLANNQLTYVSSFKKTNLNSLKAISLYENKIVSGQPFTFMKISSEVQLIRLSIFSNKTQNMQNINWIFKLQCTSLEQVCYNSQKIIKTKKISEKLPKKYKNISIKNSLY